MSGKVGFGSGDYKGRGALFHPDSFNRWSHALKMEDMFYIKEDHSLDGFEKIHGGSSYLAIRTKEHEQDSRQYQYDVSFGPQSQSDLCPRCKADSYRCVHKRAEVDPKRQCKYPVTNAQSYGWEPPYDTYGLN